MKKLIKKILPLLFFWAAANGCSSPTYETYNPPEPPEPEPYGKYSTEIFEQDSAGTYNGKINGRYFLHPTGINVSDGDSIDARASGEIYWGWDDARGGPDKTYTTWGLYLVYGGEDFLENCSMYQYAGSHYSSKVRFDPEYSDTSLELFFVIPEGEDKTRYYPGYYSDNEGHFDVDLDVIAGE